MEFFLKKSNTIRSKPVQHQNNLIVAQPNIANSAQKVPILLDQKFGIICLLILSLQKRLKYLKKLIKSGDREIYVSVKYAHIRIFKSCENKQPKNRS